MADVLVINVPKEPTVLELAALLGKKPACLMADLFKLGVFASVRQRLSLDTASKVAQKYGYVARQA